MVKVTTSSEMWKKSDSKVDMKAQLTALQDEKVFTSSQRSDN